MNQAAFAASLIHAWRLCRWPVLAVVLLDLHVLLAPWTIQKTQQVLQDWTEGKARRDSGKYLAGLRKVPEIPLKNFISFTTAFRDHLERQSIKLTVVLWPQPEALMEKPGVPQLHPGPPGAVMLQAAKALRREHVKVIEPFAEIHEQLCRHPEGAAFLPDGHLGMFILRHGTDQIISSIDPKLITRNGRGFLIAGDSYSNILHMAFLKRPALAEAQVFWRGGGANRVPYEIAALKPAAFQGIHQLIWVIPSHYLLEDADPKRFPPLAASLATRMPEVPGQRTLRATITEVPGIPENLGENSPYPDALLQCRFHAKNGENFLGLAQIMRKHELDRWVRRWEVGVPLVLTLVPWDGALRASPALQHQQILDGTPDFTLPRYFVSSWVIAPP